VVHGHGNTRSDHNGAIYWIQTRYSNAGICFHPTYGRHFFEIDPLGAGRDATAKGPLNQYFSFDLHRGYPFDPNLLVRGNVSLFIAVLLPVFFVYLPKVSGKRCKIEAYTILFAL
jgi:hypothetical protein